MAVVEVTAQTFEQEVLKAEGTVLVDFWADWCGPCKMVSPIVDQVAEVHPEVKVCKVNVDTESSLAIDYRVMSIPTLIVFRGGEVVTQARGVQSKEYIEGMISE